MLQLRVTVPPGGPAALEVHRFPVHVGRDAECEARIEGPGVWGRHLRIDLDPGQGFSVGVCEGAVARLNGEPLTRARLRPGDRLDLGSARVEVGLSPALRRSFTLAEAAFWVALATLVVVEVLAAVALGRG